MCKLPEDRFWPKIRKTDTCWEWMAERRPAGHGKFRFGGKTDGAHRFSYQLHKGPIPKGYDVHHACENKSCVNPDHLAAVTRRENLMASDTLPRRQASKTHCPQGHPYDERNTYVGRGGSRQCRKCNAKRANAWLTMKVATDPEFRQRRLAYLSRKYCEKKARNAGR